MTDVRTHAVESLAMAKRKNPHAVALGRLGGKKGGSRGGNIAASKLSPEERRERERKAAQARWGKGKRL